MRHLAGEMRQGWPEPRSNISPLMAHRGAPQVTAPQIGANYVQAKLWRGFAIRDGNLITGQQNFSGEETARLLLDRWADSHAGPSPGSPEGTFVSS